MLKTKGRLDREKRRHPYFAAKTEKCLGRTLDDTRRFVKVVLE